MNDRLVGFQILGIGSGNMSIRLVGKSNNFEIKWYISALGYGIERISTSGDYSGMRVVYRKNQKTVFIEISFTFCFNIFCAILNIFRHIFGYQDT